MSQQPLNTFKPGTGAPVQSPGAGAIIEGLRDVDGLREVLWPDEESRPSRRFIWGLKRSRAIPFISMRGRTWYEPAKVLAALRKMESAAIL